VEGNLLLDVEGTALSWMEKLVISRLRRTSGDSMEVVQEGSSEFWVAKVSLFVDARRAVAGVDENAPWPGKNEVSLFTVPVLVS
jgi:hypothetical protein